jgi:hypothetical protein
VLAHTHRTIERTVSQTQEVLYIRKGKVQITLYDNEHVFLSEKILVTGDVILLASGGHALKMLEDSEIIEVKQGPYSGDEDKRGFVPVDKYEYKTSN